MRPFLCGSGCIDSGLVSRVASDDDDDDEVHVDDDGRRYPVSRV
jgi:hypothetical protein